MELLGERASQRCTMSGARYRSPLRRACVASAAALTVLAMATPAAALTIPLPQGEACEDFPVTLDIGDDSKRRTRTFTDRNGNTVTMVTGAAESVSVTNAVTGESLTVTSRGARTRQTEHADGTTTVEFTGHLLLVLFSSDVGGDGLTPTSTTLIAGRTVITIDENGVFTVESVSGKTTDICAALAA